jgi:penicillin-binding protein 1A
MVVASKSWPYYVSGMTTKRTPIWAQLRARWTPRVRRYVLLCGVGSIGLGLGAIYGSWTRACAGASCPSIGVLESYRPTQALKVYAADGRLITEAGVERRTVLAVGEIDPILRAAFLAVEDKRFYEHRGVDLIRFLGAAKRVVLALDYVEGFSTITMQLARNVFREQLPTTKTISRKVREIQVALELERTYSKDRILELYLNQIFLGGSAYGVESGAQAYFGKSARSLNPAEAAALAAIANVPNNYNPRRHPDRVIRRRNLVLNLMRDGGYLAPEETEVWKAYPLEVSSREDYGDVAQYFVESVRQQLYARFGNAIYERGYRVYTTLDLDTQIAAERALESQLEYIESGGEGPYRHITYQQYLDSLEVGESNLARAPYLQGAVVTLDVDSGYVRAMVGGRDYGDSEFNRATQAQRQAGSTFKPFVYLAAIRANYPPSYMINDGPISIMQNDTMPWEPQNFDDRFYGPMTMRRGLYLSRNLVAIQLGMQLGVPAVVGEASRFGFSTPIPGFNSMFIGSASVIPIEMASAYTAFASLGTQVAPRTILRVEDARGNIVWEPQTRRTQIISRERMYLVTNMMRDVIRRGTAFGPIWARGGFHQEAAGKTGTTNDGTDVWFIGFTPDLVTAVWIGFDQPQKIKSNAQGGRLAAPVWAQFMNEVYERRAPAKPWERPEGLIVRQIDNSTGYIVHPLCPRDVRYFEWFVPGTEPTEICPVHNRLIPGLSTPPDDSPDGPTPNH